jgi:phosphoribosyl-ATP pyrophosphohydrolase/phosphoribosyl-AMP cyclohydrolase
VGSGRREGGRHPVEGEAPVRTEAFWEDLHYGPDGLLPVAVQSADDGRLLMLAWANREAVQRTARERRAWFWSRSRNALWRKGDTSGHRLDVVRVAWDCDADALLYLVEAHGPTCHTGNPSCFYRGEPHGPVGAAAARGGLPPMGPGEGPGEPVRVGLGAGDGPGGVDPGSAALGATLADLAALVARRHREMPEGSYVASLLAAGRPRVLQKLGEEGIEVILASAGAGSPPGAEVVGEFADLCLHLLVALEAVGVSPGALADELRRRHALRPPR